MQLGIRSPIRFVPAAFPFTAQIDNFTRADENPLATSSSGATWSATWNGQSGVNTALKVSTNLAAGSAASLNSQAISTTFNRDQEAWMTVSVAPTGGIIIGVWLRLALTGGLQRGYRFTWDSTNSGEFAFTSFAASSPSVLATATGISLSPGDQFGARAIGTSLIGYKNGVKVLTTSDGNSVVASQIGLTIPQTVGRVSAFGGGNL